MDEVDEWQWSDSCDVVVVLSLVGVPQAKNLPYLQRRDTNSFTTIVLVFNPDIKRTVCIQSFTAYVLQPLHVHPWLPPNSASQAT